MRELIIHAVRAASYVLIPLFTGILTFTLIFNSTLMPSQQSGGMIYLRVLITGEWYVLPPKTSFSGLFFQFQAGQFEG